jgi:lysophospholipase L1-like esterase
MRMQEIRSAVKDPDIILLMTGINNIAMEDTHITGTYKKIVASLVSSYKDALVIIQSILPVLLPWVDNRLIERTNQSLKAMAREYKTEYLDIYSVFADKEKRPVEGYLLDDGVHISDRGYEVWAKVVEDFLMEASH